MRYDEHAAVPRQLLRDCGIVILPGTIEPREARAWLVEWRATRGVLRRVPTPDDPAALGQLIDDLSWLHSFLLRLAETGFAAPKPLPAFGGRSWTVAENALWELVSFIPGETVCWAQRPTMEEIGALLARYHQAARGVAVAHQRPAALPLADVPAILLSGRVRAAGIDGDRAAILRDLAEELARDLAAASHTDLPRLVIHGDFTNHNVVASGSPPKPTGVIDFALAHVETPLADIGYGLWRSGRPCQEADRIDVARVRRFVAGYASVARLSHDQARLISVYLRGRGLQMIAKRVRASRPDIGMLTQVRWLSANSGSVARACDAALHA